MAMQRMGLISSEKGTLLSFFPLSRFRVLSGRLRNSQFLYFPFRLCKLLLRRSLLFLFRARIFPMYRLLFRQNFHTSTVYTIGFLTGFALVYILAYIRQGSFISLPSEEIRSKQTPQSSDKDGSQTEQDSFSKPWRVLCWILTVPSNHMSRALYVKQTWGKRCDKLLFFSSQNDTNLPAIAILGNSTEAYKNLPVKVRKAVQYLYQTYINEFDWFFKADDDTYVIVENLRLVLKDFHPQDLIAIGSLFQNRLARGFYLTGGAGYVLSRTALERIAVVGPKLCNYGNMPSAEDYQMGYCLQSVGVKLIDGLDQVGLPKFFQFSPEKYLNPQGIQGSEKWVLPNIVQVPQPGLNCCSKYTVSFHKMNPVHFFAWEFFIYHLRIYGDNPTKQN